MKTQLAIQDPRDDNTSYAVDAIGKAADGATHGYALFAFATAAGIELLLKHENVQRLMSKGVFEIVVGLDAITNRAALEKLLEAADQFPGLHPKVFWNETSGIFHPKLCRFRTKRQDVWIIGSGNLTPRGLRDNYEAFAIIRGNSKELSGLNTLLDGFRAANSEVICDIDKAALDRAAKNKFTRPIEDIEPARTRQVQSGTVRDRVLVAELPRGGARWQQANFDNDTAQSFFGVDRTSGSLSKDLYLTLVDRAGAGINEEVRRFTFTRSKNLRIQLAAKNGIAYPKRGRPIAVFRQVKKRHFAYQLLLPGERGHSALTKLLDRTDLSNVRRHITSLKELCDAWPACPLGKG